MPKSAASSPQTSPVYPWVLCLCQALPCCLFPRLLMHLRLAADEGDHSEQIHCRWTIMGPNLNPINSSSGVTVQPWETYRDPAEFDYIVVVGGLLPETLNGSQHLIRLFAAADQAHMPIIGLCTGSFAMIRAGLMHHRRCCVSWFHSQGSD